MKLKRSFYGLMSLLSLIGFIGIFTEERLFLAFFAFIVNIEYFFIKSDEMLEEYMNQSAARGFYCGMIATAAVVLYSFFIDRQSGQEALITGFTSAWAVSVIIYALSISYYSFKEQWGLADDKE